MASTSREAVYSLINRKNGTEYNASVVSFGPPVEVTDPQVSVKNTQLTLTAVPGSGRIGTKTVYYNRRDIKDVVGVEDVELDWDEELRVVDLLPKINALLKTNMLAEDVVDNAIPEGVDGVVTFGLVMNAGSYGWHGFFNVKLTVPPVDIANEITEPTLDNFTPTDLQDQ